MLTTQKGRHLWLNQRTSQRFIPVSSLREARRTEVRQMDLSRESGGHVALRMGHKVSGVYFTHGERGTLCCLLILRILRRSYDCMPS